PSVATHRRREADEASDRPNRQQHAKSEDRHAAPNVRNAKKLTTHCADQPMTEVESRRNNFARRLAPNTLPSDGTPYRMAPNQPTSADSQIVDQPRLADPHGQSNDGRARDCGYRHHGAVSDERDIVDTFDPGLAQMRLHFCANCINVALAGSGKLFS